MKRLLTIADSTENKITYFHLLLFVVSLPFDRFYSQLFLISLFIHTMIQLKKKNFSAIPWKETLLMQSVYLLTMAGTVYTMHSSIAFGLWEKQFAIFLFPLLLFLNSIDLKKYTRHLLYAFTSINILVILYLYFDALRIIAYYDMPIHTLFSGLFFSHKFSAPIDIHATYLSLYCAMSLVAVLYFFLSVKRTTKEKMIACLAAVILSAGLIQLGSRAVISGVLVIVLFIYPPYITNTVRRKNFVIISLLITLALSGIIYFSEGLNYRFVKSLKTDLGIGSSGYSISDPRAQRWELAWQLFLEKPVFGHGSGDEVPLLKEKYFENKFYDSYLHELNAHNQYLSFLIKGGMIALAVYVFTLFYFFRFAYRRQNLPFLSFLSLLIIAGFSENILNVNKGIFFFAFFLSLFACGELKKLQKPGFKPGTGNHIKQKNVFKTKELTA